MWKKEVLVAKFGATEWCRCPLVQDLYTGSDFPQIKDSFRAVDGSLPMLIVDMQ